MEFSVLPCVCQVTILTSSHLLNYVYEAHVACWVVALGEGCSLKLCSVQVFGQKEVCTECVRAATFLATTAD